MSTQNNAKNGTEAGSDQQAGERRRIYNSAAMNDRRDRIVAATLAFIEEGGLNAVTIRSVSRRANVALRTLYLYFDSKEAMIAVAINQFFENSMSDDGVVSKPRTFKDVADRFDWLSGIIRNHRAYSAALAPIYFSDNLDPDIRDVLREIALTHVTPFLDEVVFQGVDSDGAFADYVRLHISSIQYSIINDALSGRLAEEYLADMLKMSVLSFVHGLLPEPAPELQSLLAGLKSRLP